MNMTREEAWEKHRNRISRLAKWGLNNGYINIYDEGVIKKLRTIYEGGLPASILVFSFLMRNIKQSKTDFCKTYSKIMAKAFLDEEGDVKIVVASIESLRLNPKYPESKDPLDSYHAFVERTTSDGRQLIYDVTIGLVTDKRLYWHMEHPQVIYEIGKEKIAEIDKTYKEYYPEGEEQLLDAAFFFLPSIELACNTSSDECSLLELFQRKLLQREIQLFKNSLNLTSLKNLEKEMEIYERRRAGHM